MRKGTDIIGKDVVALNSGAKLNSINDLVFDQDANQVLGFVVDEGGWSSNAKVIPLQAIHSIGPDALIVADASAIVDAGRIPEIYAILERDNVLNGTTLMTTDGRDLGQLTDLFFAEDSGEVEGYETSGGIFDDLSTGRAFIPAQRTLQIGDATAFVPPEVANLLSEIQRQREQQKAEQSHAATSQQRQLLGRVADKTVAADDGTMILARGEQVTPLTIEIAQRHQCLDAVYAATGTAPATSSTPALADAVGRVADEAVRTDTGHYVVAAGQIVTQRQIARAQQWHKERALLRSVGLLKSADKTDAYRDRLAAGTQTVKDEASSAWDSLKETFSDWRERAAEQTQAKRIEHALGRPVNRVILDRQDQVILNTGEIITHKAVQLARENDALDMLLSSVYDHEPPLTVDKARAAGSGEAALEPPSDSQPAHDQSAASRQQREQPEQ